MSDNKVPTVVTWHLGLEALIQPSRMYVPFAFVDDTLEQKLLTKEGGNTDYHHSRFDRKSKIPVLLLYNYPRQFPFKIIF